MPATDSLRTGSARTSPASEGQGRVAQPGGAEHRGREVDPDAAGAALDEVAGDVRGTAADVEHEPPRRATLRHAIEHAAVELEPGEVFAEGRRVVVDDRLVSGANDVRVEAACRHSLSVPRFGARAAQERLGRNEDMIDHDRPSRPLLVAPTISTDFEKCLKRATSRGAPRTYARVEVPRTPASKRFATDRECTMPYGVCHPSQLAAAQRAMETGKVKPMRLVPSRVVPVGEVMVFSDETLIPVLDTLDRLLVQKERD